MAEIVDAERWEVVGGQRLQGEAGGAASDDEAPLVPVAGQLDVGAFRQFAHDVVEHMGRHGGGPFALGAGRHRLHQLHVEVGGGELQLVVPRGEQDVGQDGNGVAPLDHARHVGERLGKAWLVDGQPHALIDTCVGAFLGVRLGPRPKRQKLR